jgi:hypothetical protein
VRHALVTVHLLHEARSASTEVARRHVADAPPGTPGPTHPRPHRFASLFRRARTFGLRAESHGGGA